jgi:DNA-binding transcriptional LysR family regulator
VRALNPDHLRAFADVVELGSFSAAAERRSLTQPAVSQQVRQLEKRFGVRLLERVGRRAQPTAAGRELLRHIAEIDGAVARAAEAMAVHRGGVIGRVRLGTGATACIYLLPPILRDLRHRFPDLQIVVSTGNTAPILKALEDNTLDIALATLPVPEAVFDVTPVFDDEQVAVFSAEAKPPRAITPATLAAWPLVLYEPGGHTRRVIDGWFERGGMPLKPVMELGSIEAIKELVAAGLGCAILPALAVRMTAAQRGLIVRRLSPPLHRKLGIVLRRDKPLGRALREVMRALTRLR